MPEELRVTTTGAYIEQAGDGTLRVTTAGAYVEWGIPQKLRVTTLGAYVEYVVPFPVPVQTEAEEARSCGRVRISGDCSTWTDVSGSVNMVTVGEAARAAGVVWKFIDPEPVVVVGQMAGVPVTVRCVYTEASSEVYEIAQAIFEGVGCGAVMCVEWTPGGGNVGDVAYQVQGVIKSWQYPAIDASQAGPILAEFVVVGDVTHAVVTT